MISVILTAQHSADASILKRRGRMSNVSGSMWFEVLSKTDS